MYKSAIKVMLVAFLGVLDSQALFLNIGIQVIFLALAHCLQQRLNIFSIEVQRENLLRSFVNLRPLENLRSLENRRSFQNLRSLKICACRKTSGWHLEPLLKNSTLEVDGRVYECWPMSRPIRKLAQCHMVVIGLEFKII